MVIAEQEADFDLDTATLQQCQDQYQYLVNELADVESQLTENKNKHLSGLPGYEAQTYFDWRGRAIRVKGHILREMREVKGRIKELGGAQRDDEWRRKCFALVDGMQDLKDNWHQTDIAAGILSDLMDKWEAGTL